MMKGKIMEEKIRIPENGSIISLLHDFTQIIPWKSTGYGDLYREILFDGPFVAILQIGACLGDANG